MNAVLPLNIQLHPHGLEYVAPSRADVRILDGRHRLADRQRLFDVDAA